MASSSPPQFKKVVKEVSLFPLFLTASLTKSKLTQAEEELQLKAFQKEALRIYMDDCLSDEQERYFQFKDSAYPCNNESFSPEFCQYTFSNTQVGFGILQLRPSTLEADLKRFLENRTLACVQQFIITNISNLAVLEPVELELELKILNDGIGADVEYPLKFKVRGQDSIHSHLFFT